MQLSIIVATLEGCSFTQLNDPELARTAIQQAVAAGGFTLLHTYVHRFKPQGITASAVLAESHINLHSWPEEGVLFIDMATCSGAHATERAFAALCDIYTHQRVCRRNHALGKTSRLMAPVAAFASAAGQV